MPHGQHKSPLVRRKYSPSDHARRQDGLPFVSARIADVTLRAGLMAWTGARFTSECSDSSFLPLPLASEGWKKNVRDSALVKMTLIARYPAAIPVDPAWFHFLARIKRLAWFVIVLIGGLLTH